MYGIQIRLYYFLFRNSGISSYPHCQRAGAVVYWLAKVAVVRQPGCDQELGRLKHGLLDYK